MKNSLLAAFILVASIASAEETSMYTDEAAMLADLEAMAVRCGTMAEGQIDVEIYGLTIRRTEDFDESKAGNLDESRAANRCIIGEGEVDPMAKTLLADGEISWAGLYGEGAIWVEAR